MTEGSTLTAAQFERLFLKARSFNRFTDRPVSEQMLRDLYETLKWGPTSQNMQPARYVFVRSEAGKQKLIATLMPGNVRKVTTAPVTVIVATDSRFYEHLPTQFLAYDARPTYENNPELATVVALRNASLQGAYLLIAARAMGLDCGPMSGFDAKTVDAAFFPDGRWRANFLVSLGYGDSSANYPSAPRLGFEQVAVFA